MRYLAGAIGIAMAACPATAHADTAGISIEAQVETFCRIYPPADDAIPVRDGVATIGMVREICNTPEGYDVHARFTNLSGGDLVVGATGYAIVDGVAVRSTPHAAVQTLAWSLRAARLADAERPVLMRVTIAPR